MEPPDPKYVAPLIGAMAHAAQSYLTAKRRRHAFGLLEAAATIVVGYAAGVSAAALAEAAGRPDYALAVGVLVAASGSTGLSKLSAWLLRALASKVDETTSPGKLP